MIPFLMKMFKIPMTIKKGIHTLFDSRKKAIPEAQASRIWWGLFSR
jgi:hypothetical protein